MFLAFCLFTFICKYCFENFREKTLSIETERGTKKLRAHPQRGGVSKLKYLAN